VPTQDITWTVPEGGGGPKYCEPALNASILLAPTFPQLLHSLSHMIVQVASDNHETFDHLEMPLQGE